MKNKFTVLKISAIAVTILSSLCAKAQVNNLRPYDKSGINVFETPKDSNAVFDKLKIQFGAGFTQSFQGLKHENASDGLYKMTPGFNTANANLFMDVQLADGIRLNLTSYLSSRHHNETWVKGGYIQFDKLPFRGGLWKDLMSFTTIKIGHMEINYGDQHFRRSDGGQTIYNPFIENYILDAFTTEIGGEIMARRGPLSAIMGVSNGMIKGNIDSLIATAQDANVQKSPAIYAKGTFDKQLNGHLRFRLSASVYTNNSSGGQTLYGGDRTGSNYFMVLEKLGAVSTTNAFSGRFNPGFSKKVNAVQLNAFVKCHGLEVFTTYENAEGRSKTEAAVRGAEQIAVDGVYRFGATEDFFIGAKYNVVTAELANVPAVTGATPAPAIIYSGDVKVDRIAFAAGWFMTKNILLKGEYVTQKYKDFPTGDYRSAGKFKGYVIQAVVGF
jgi:hypothetical protein